MIRPRDGVLTDLVEGRADETHVIRDRISHGRLDTLDEADERDRVRVDVFRKYNPINPGLRYRLWRPLAEYPLGRPKDLR